MVLAVPSAFAGEVVSAYAICSWVRPETTLAVTVKYEKGEVSFYYWGEAFILVPLPSGFVCVDYHVWDDQGYDRQELFVHAREGSLVFKDYTHRGGWLHVWVRWQYVGACWIILPSCRVDLYIPNGEPSGNGRFFIRRAGGGSGKCRLE